MYPNRIFQLSVVALVGLPSYVIARTPTVVACESGEVLTTTTIPHKDSEIVVTTKACPDSVARRRNLGTAARSLDSSRIAQRDVLICNSDCVTSCYDLGPTAEISDCQELTEDLYNIPNTETFLAPAQTVTTFTLNSCAIAFLNLDEVAYDACYHWVGISGTSASACFTPEFGLNGGICEPGLVAGESDWVVEAYGTGNA